jgi:hypothetical protein
MYTRSSHSRAHGHRKSVALSVGTPLCPYGIVCPYGSLPLCPYGSLPPYVPTVAYPPYVPTVAYRRLTRARRRGYCRPARRCLHRSCPLPVHWVQGSGFRVQGSGFRVQGSGFRVQGSGFRVQGPHGALVRYLCTVGIGAFQVISHESAAGLSCAQGLGYTLHPTPYTLHPTPYALRPTPYALHPTPYTLHPTPYTLHPTPYTLRRTRTAGRASKGSSSGRMRSRPSRKLLS